MNKIFNYLDFEIEATKHRKGSNQWEFRAIIYKNKGFKEEEYSLKYFYSFTSNYKEALINFKLFLEDCVNNGITFKTNGLTKSTYLKSINDK